MIFTMFTLCCGYRRTTIISNRLIRQAVTLSSEISVETIKNDLVRLLTKQSASNLSSSKEKIESLTAQLEAILQPSHELQFPGLWEKLEGNWKLLYSNVLKASRPEDSIAGIDSVYQRIRSESRQVDHILTFRIPSPVKSITLQHESHVTSSENPAQLQISLNDVNVDGILGAYTIPFLPSLGPLRNFRSLRSITYDVSLAIIFQWSFDMTPDV